MVSRSGMAAAEGVAVALLVLVAGAAAGPVAHLAAGWRLCRDPGRDPSNTGSGGGAACYEGVEVPATVVAGLAQASALPFPPEEVYNGENLRALYPLHLNASVWSYQRNLTAADLRQAAPHAPAALPSGLGGSPALLTLNGINYRASVWVDGVLRAQCVGAFRHCDVPFRIAPSGLSSLRVDVAAPSDYIWNRSAVDLGITFVDWAPAPPDSSMGLWQSVELRVAAPGSGGEAQLLADPRRAATSATSATSAALAAPTPGSAVAVRFPVVATQLDASTWAAELTVSVDVRNYGSAATPASAWLSLSIPAIGCSARTSVAGLAPNASRLVVLGPAQAACLALADSRPFLWWPWHMGTPTLLNLTLSYGEASAPVFSSTHRFGVREVGSRLNGAGNLAFTVNHQPLQVLGGGYSPDLLLRNSPARTTLLFEHVRDLGLNAVRMEGKFEEDYFYATADEFGVLLLPGWCCCDAWQHWDLWGDEQMLVARESLRSQVQRLRGHPSVLVFLVGSDEIPPPNVEKMFRAVFEAEHWPNAILTGASNRTSTLSGPTGVKMNGPYAWVPPVYWEDPVAKSTYGGPFGFATEISPGATPLSLPSWEATVPKTKLWPINDYWDFHCGSEHGLFGSLQHFLPALTARYGASQDLAHFLKRSQLSTYESQRAMFEAYARNPGAATGIVQWMLNNAMPQHVWHLVDWYLDSVNGGYHGTKKALEPTHASFAYTTSTVWLGNARSDHAQHNVTVAWLLTDLGLKTLASGSAMVPAVAPHSSVRVTALENAAGQESTHLLRLTAQDTEGRTLSRSVYWLRAGDTLDWAKSSFYQTPCSSFADMTDLSALPATTVDTAVAAASPTLTAVVVSNRSPRLAFFVELTLMAGSSRVVPSRWSDNFVTLWPGETLNLTVAHGPLSGGGPLAVQALPFNGA